MLQNGGAYMLGPCTVILNEIDRKLRARAAPEA
jgi:hypothetical protein